MTICCQLSNHCHCSLQLDDWILKEENKKFNWNLQDSILRKKHWRPTEGLTVGGEATETKHGAWRWHQGLPLRPLHWAGSSVFSDHFPLQWAAGRWCVRSAQQIEFPANFFTSRHSVDHDIGQGRPPFSPASQTIAVESDAVEPLQSLLGVLAL